MEKSRAVVIGITSSFISVFVATIFVTTFYRFPVPFAEQYAMGFEGIGTSLKALFFYGILGVFVIVLAIGLFSGLLVRRLQVSEWKQEIGIIGIPAILNLAVVVFLATLEEVIGPW